MYMIFLTTYNDLNQTPFERVTTLEADWSIQYFNYTKKYNIVKTNT